MATEFDDALHFALFKGAGALQTGNSYEVRWSSITLAALRAAGVFDNLIDGFTPPATDKLWLDKNLDPPVLKIWDEKGTSWEVMTFDRLFARASVTVLTPASGTPNAIVVNPVLGFRNDALYTIRPTDDNTGPTSIQVPGEGTYPAKYTDGTDVEPGEFTAGRQNIMLFTGSAFLVLFQMSDLNAATARAIQAADEAEGYRDQTADYAAEAQALVTAAEAGFTGFPSTAAYDFGFISDATTYFDQDWGDIA